MRRLKFKNVPLTGDVYVMLRLLFVTVKWQVCQMLRVFQKTAWIPYYYRSQEPERSAKVSKSYSNYANLHTVNRWSIILE